MGRRIIIKKKVAKPKKNDVIKKQSIEKEVLFGIKNQEKDIENRIKILDEKK